ncbi:MAG: hypothetical protein OEV72_04715 [Thermoleophilia bacterium]|nr:hypothetical protein [Thermoleophilia bacterium]MDH5332442.1 hypothetical protein [Thermoleophilia bacterium]
MGRRLGLPLVVVLKATTIVLTAVGAFGGLERFEEKGFGWRLLWYPIAVLALPVVWRLAAQARPYPYAADALLTAPFLIDVLGNVVDFYDKIGWWDDVNHFANWLFLSLGAGALLLRTTVGPLIAAGLVIAFGSTLVILWELGEYMTFLRGNEEELPTAYRDTIGDMTFGLLGSLIAAGATWYAVHRQRRHARDTAVPPSSDLAAPAA